MNQLRHPKVLLFTEYSTYFIKPQHDPAHCTKTKTGPRNLNCPGCQYDSCVELLLELPGVEDLEEVTSQEGVTNEPV